MKRSRRISLVGMRRVDRFVVSTEVVELTADLRQDMFEPTLRDAEPDFPKMSESRKQAPKEDDMRIPPTQRMSQVGSLTFEVWRPTDFRRFAALVSSIEM